MSKVKAKNYGYESKKKQEEPKLNKKAIGIGLGFFGFLMAVVVVLICVEKGMENKFVIKNKSSHAITKVSYWYTGYDSTKDEEGEEIGEVQITEVMDLGAVAAKQKRKESTESHKLSELTGEALLCVYIEFADGGDVVLESGQFLYDFNGKISLELKDSAENEVTAWLKAGEGLFNSTAVTGCDDVYYINPKDGYIE